MHLDAGRQGRLDRRQDLLDLRDGLYDIGAGQRKDNHAHRRHIVEEPGIADVLIGIHHGGDIMQEYRRSVAIGNDEIAVIRRLGRLVVGDHLVAPIPLIDMTLGAVRIGCCDRGAHVLESDAVTAQLVGLELDSHRGQGAAAERNLADAGDLRQLLLDDGIGRIVELCRRQGARRQR